MPFSPDYLYGTVLHDSKVAQSWVILLGLWQVTVTFPACKKGSDQKRGCVPEWTEFKSLRGPSPLFGALKP